MSYSEIKEQICKNVDKMNEIIDDINISNKDQKALKDRLNKHVNSEHVGMISKEEQYRIGKIPGLEEEVKGLGSALDNKLNKTEPALTTTSKEVVGAVNENKVNIDYNTKQTDDFFSVSNITSGNIADIINQKISQGINIKFPSKTILIDKPIVWNGEVTLFGVSQELSKIAPTSDFVGEALLVAPTTNSKFKKGSISNITFDCKFKADTGVWLKNGCFLTFKNSTIKNFLSKGLYLGVYGGANRVYASFFTDLKICGDDTFSKPLSSYPNYCIVAEQSSFDNNFINMFIWNAKESLFLDRAGSNRIISCHGWGDLPSNFPKYCFDLSGNGTLISNSKADSPQIAGFKINNFQNFIIGNQVLLNNTTTNGYNACFFEISSDNNNGTKILNNMCTHGGIYPPKDTIFNCNTIHTSCLIKNNQIASGWRYLNAYDTYLHNIPTSTTAFNVTFPKPLSTNRYIIEAQALYEAGKVTVTNKTETGYTVNVEIPPSNGYNNLITSFKSMDA